MPSFVLPVSSIVLIGMPGVGKSTVGVLLAKELAMNFVDTDLLIQRRAKKTLQDIMDASGYQFLRQLEETVILDQDLSNAVVATGGSAVYGTESMAKLSGLGPVVYLSSGVDALLERITDYSSRGIAAPAGQSFDDIAAEREELFRKYADFEISTEGVLPAQVVKNILTHPALNL